MTTFWILAITLMALMGAPIFAVFSAFAALGVVTLAGNVEHGLVQAFGSVLIRVQALATGDQATTLSTIPLFTFTGYVMAEAGTAARLVRCAKALVGWIPGGLAIVTIFTCAIFTTFTGASGVTIVAIGGLLLPALIKEGYKERFALGLIAGTGSVGLLIPPALPLIIYGVVYGASAQAAAASSGDALQLIDFDIARFLLAGALPFAVLAGILVVYSVHRAIRDKVPTTPFDLGEAARSLLAALPELAIPILVMLPMFTGWLQIPEVAAATALYVLVIELFVYRDVKLKNLGKIARNSMGLVGAIFLIIVGATALTDYFVDASIPSRLFDWISAHIEHRWAFLLGLNVLLLIVGCVMDIFSAIMIMVPLIAPAAAAYHIDPYHLGIIFLINLEVGYLHPPVGLNLIITTYHFRKPMAEAVWATLPFLGLMILALLIVTYVPALVPIKAKSSDAAAESSGAGKPAAANLADAGPTAIISLDDGGVLSAADCEKPEVKENELDYLECKNKFVLYDKCNALSEPLDKLECQQKALEGEAWSPEGEGEGEEADAAPAAPVDGDAAAAPAASDGDAAPATP